MEFIIYKYIINTFISQPQVAFDGKMSFCWVFYNHESNLHLVYIFMFKSDKKNQQLKYEHEFRKISDKAKFP